ncbi:MAG: universal stress protein [Desulfovibrionales bacterium]
MASPGKKRILAAVDGSEQAREAVRYLSRILPADQAEIVLLCICEKISEHFWDLDKDNILRHKALQIRAWECHQQQCLKEYMDQTEQILLDAGFPSESVTVIQQEKKEGIARDIIAESRNEFHAVVVGRSGVSNLKDLVIGSVANKIVERLAGIPLWVVGGTPGPGKILVCMDTSEGAMKSVDHVASMLDGSEVEVSLFHAVRTFDFFSRSKAKGSVRVGDESGIFAEGLGSADRAVSQAFKEAKRRLVAAGMKPENINARIVKGVSSRVAAILAEAKRGEYGTIVVGRRKGLCKMENFFMGRVSSKMMQVAKNCAVWIVS